MQAALTVLIIDDERDVRDVIAGVFKAAGWEILIADHGEQGLILAARELPSLVVLDVMMPGKTGFMVLKELRSDPRTSKIPVIMVTAVNEYELGLRHDADSTGCAAGVRPPEAFFEKPLDCEGLLKAADEIVSRGTY